MAFAFRAIENAATKRIEYRCALCEREEDGGTVVNSGLWDRMRDHLQHAHAITDVEKLTPVYTKRDNVIDVEFRVVE